MPTSYTGVLNLFKHFRRNCARAVEDVEGNAWRRASRVRTQGPLDVAANKAALIDIRSLGSPIGKGHVVIEPTKNEFLAQNGAIGIEILKEIAI